MPEQPEAEKRPGRTVYLSQDQWTAVDQVAEEMEVSGAAVVRMAVREFLAAREARPQALAA